MQILEGVTENDKVVATGAYGLPDNTKIKVEAPPAKLRRRHPRKTPKEDPSEK